MTDGSMHPEIQRHVNEISRRTKYPIRNFGQLLQALGGPDAALEFEGWRAPAGRLKEIVPDYYFPVVSEEDLANKAQDLWARYANLPRPGVDAPAQPEEEMPEPLRAEWAALEGRNMDLMRIHLPRDSDAQAGIARLSEE